MEIRKDDLTAPAVLDLLRLHLAGMEDESPPESVHALGAEASRGYPADDPFSRIMTLEL